MEPILLIMAATYMVSGKFRKDRSLAAYKAGHEPEGLVKARLRHEAGGGRFVTRPGKDRKPKGPGATRLLITSRWANACEKSKTKGEDKLKAWQAWYAKEAPTRHQAWRDKQTRKLQKRANKLDKWQSAWAKATDATRNLAAGAKDALSRRDDAELEPTGESDPVQKPQDSGNTEPATEPANASANAGAESAPPQPTNTSSTQQEGDAVYKSGASTMQNHAAEVEGYRKALTSLGEDMAYIGWGNEVHTPLTNMHAKLKSVAARYRNLGEDVQHQGDQVNDSYDEAPWSPDHKVLTQ